MNWPKHAKQATNSLMAVESIFDDMQKHVQKSGVVGGQGTIHRHVRLIRGARTCKRGAYIGSKFQLFTDLIMLKHPCNKSSYSTQHNLTWNLRIDQWKTILTFVHNQVV